MRTAILLTICVTFSLMLTQQSPVSAQKKVRAVAKVKIGVGGGKAVGGNSETPANTVSAKPGEKLEALPAESRETFTRLVLADLPPALSYQFEEIAERLSERVGTTLTPEWWRLNLCSMSCAEPINGAAVAEALGMEIVSDVSEILILAPELTRAAQRAEARLLLIDLFWDREVRLWSGTNSTGVTEDVQAKANERRKTIDKKTGLGALRKRLKGKIDKDKAEKNKYSGEKLNPQDVYKNGGSLDEVNTLAALGIKPEQAHRAMKHYKLSDFTVGYQTTYEKEPTEWGGSRTTEKRRFVVSANSGSLATSFPPEPLADTGIDEFFEQLQRLIQNMFGMPMWGRGSSWSRYYEEDERQPDSTLYVAQYFDNVKQDTSDISKLEEKLEKQIENQPDKDKRMALRRELLDLKSLRSIAVSPMWVDGYAVALRTDTSENQLSVAKSKRQLAVQVAAKFSGWRAANPTAEPRYGSLPSVYDHYDIGWGEFDSGPWSFYNMEVYKVSDAFDANGNASKIGFRTSHPADMPVDIHIALKDGVYTWTSGEPEPEALIIGRREEVDLGVSLLSDAVTKVADGESEAPQAYDADWVRSIFEAGQFEPLYLSAEDFTVLELLPGVLRIKGENATRITSQSLVIDTQTGMKFWETMPPDSIKEQQDDYYDDW